MKKVVIALNALLPLIFIASQIGALIKSGNVLSIAAIIPNIAIVVAVPLLNIIFLTDRWSALTKKKLLLVSLNGFWIITMLVWVFYNVDGFYLRYWSELGYGFLLSIPYIFSIILILKRGSVVSGKTG